MKKLLITFLATFSLLAGYAVNSNPVTGNWSSPASWVGGVVPAPGTIVVIVSGANITVDVAVTRTTTTTVNSGGTLTLGATLTSNGSSVTITGTLNCGTNIIDGSSSFTLTSTTTAFLFTGNANGITASGTIAGSIQNTSATRSFGANATYVYNGNVNQSTGNGLPASIGALTINNSGSAPNNVVTLTTSPLEIKANPATGALTLTLGVFRPGTGGVVNFNNNSSTNALTNNGGDLAVTGINGSDGGKVILLTGSGANFTISGTGVTHFYDLSFGTAVGAANRNVVQNTANKVVINGTLTMQDNQSKWSTNSPIYSANATLYVNNNNLGYTPGSGQRLEWMAMASGTIGTTAGYPNNVTLVNIGNSLINGCGFGPAGTWSIYGTLSIGDGTVAGLATLEAMTAFTCGGITIDNGSTLKHAAETFTVKGNWRQQGSTIGIFAPTTVSSSSAVIFGGSGTSVTPQIISASAGTLTFGNGTNSSGITINNNTYVKLNSPVTLQNAHILTLTSGILETSSSNILYLKNTAVAAITGSGSSTTYINGPVKWDVALASKYTLPLGKGAVYLPFDITPAAAASNTITAEAFNSNAAGTPDGITVTSLSNTEYWSLSATSSFSSGAIVSAARISGNGSNNMLAKSTTVNGIYSGIGGSAGTVGSITGIINGSAGTASPWYIVMAYGPLSINVTNIVYPGCTGVGGAITVSGSGGVPPYTYNINGGSYQASGTFSGLAAGTYTLGVKDSDIPNTTKTTIVTIDALVITPDTGTCSGSSIQLQTLGQPVWSYSWSPSTGLSSTTIANPVATPASTTTYTLNAVVVDNTTNLISDGDFETNSTITAPAQTEYILSTVSPYGSFNGGLQHNGVYLITSNANLMCTNFYSPSGFGPQNGTKMLVIDGPNNGGTIFTGNRIWYQTVSGLSINTSYLFSYWTRRASVSSPDAQINTVIKDDLGTTLSFLSGSSANPYTVNPSTWTKISYLVNTGSRTSITISMYDPISSDIGDDFAMDNMSLYITCNPSRSVTVAITTTPTLNTVTPPVKVCAGSGASINLTGLTIVDTFTVNYTINGILQIPISGVISDGSGNATFTSAALTALNNGQILQVTSLTNTGAHSNCTQTFTGKTVTLTVNATGTWLGTISTDWNTASNWCGGVPVATTDVLIPDYGVGGVYPIIAAATAGTCKNITISTNASATINTNGSLAVSGTYSSSGALTNNGELILNSSSVAQSFPGPTGTVSAMNNFTINNTSGLGVTFNRDFSIYGTLTPTAGNVNVNNAYVTLTSTATTTARVGVVGTSVLSYTGTGKFVVERYYPGRRKWRLITAPVVVDGTKTIFNSWQVGGNNSLTGSGTYVSGPVAPSFGLDVSPLNNSSLKTFDYTTSAFNPVLNTLTSLISGLQAGNTSSLSNLAGYFMFVRGDRTPANVDAFNAYGTVLETTLRDTGTLKTGSYSFACNPGSGGNIYTLIGNPYASPVDFSTLTRSNVANKFWAWDPNLGGANGVGGYIILDASPGPGYGFTRVPTTSTGTISQTLDIQSSQAFLVETTGSSPSITFNESNKSANDNRSLFRPADNTIQVATLAANIYLREDDGSTEIADGVVTQFNRAFSSTTDKLDAAKFTNVNETFSIASNNTYLSLERRPLLTERDTLFYSLARTKRRNYSFNVYVQHFTQNNLVAFLEDRYLKKRTRVNMNGDTWVNFNINADPGSADKNRFRIVFKKLVRISSVHATVINNDIAVDWNIESEYGDERYEIERSVDGTTFELAGRCGSNGISETRAYSWLDTKPVPGIYYYRIKCISNDDFSYSDIVKVMITKANPSVYIFPNPVVGDKINLQMSMMPTGKYTVALIDNNGREVLTNSIDHVAGSSVENFDMKKGLATGTYHLKISGPGNYRSTLKVLYK